MIDQSFLDLFTNIESEEGRFLWVMMIVSFLFGFFIALLLRWSRIRAIKKELKTSQKSEQTLQDTAAELENQLQERNLELQEASREKVDLMDRACEVEESQQQHLSEVFQLNQQIEELQNANKAYAASVDALNAQILDLKEGNQQLAGVAASVPSSTADYVGKNEYNELQQRLNAIEASLNKVSSENSQLRSDLQMLEKKSNSVSVATDSEEPELKIFSEKTILNEKIIADDRQKDDLTKIEGIGEFIARKLHSIGVFTYEDIARWDNDTIQSVTASIEYIPGRILKDDWVGQAANLLNDTSKKSIPDTESDDLKRIEGIGPKIEEVLNAAGIQTWTTLASTEPGKLKEILENAGGRFRMHSPYTWPLQARLAAAGRWDELDEYQEELKGGKEA